jgi:protein SCO1/2
MSFSSKSLPFSCRLVPVMLLMASGGSSLARPPALSETDLARIQFTQNLNTQVPLDLRFVNEEGREIRLGDYFKGKPVILVPGYYGCPMLCTLVLNGLVESMEDMKWRVGTDFEIINFSINPEEGPALAAAKKRNYLKRYGRSGAERGWHFLTGQESAIQALSHSIGFAYQFDPATRQYAHPSGVVIITPEGRVARYLFGVNFASRELYGSLKDAAAEHVSSPVQQLLLLCFHYNPLTGKYSASILGVLRLMSAATALALLAWIIVAVLRSRAS